MKVQLFGLAVILVSVVAALVFESATYAFIVALVGLVIVFGGALIKD